MKATQYLTKFGIMASGLVAAAAANNEVDKFMDKKFQKEHPGMKVTKSYVNVPTLSTFYVTREAVDQQESETAPGNNVPAPR